MTANTGRPAGAAAVVADPEYPYDTPVAAAERAADPALAERQGDGSGNDPEPAGGDGDGKPKRGFPSPLTILLIVIFGVWLLAWFIPAGRFTPDAATGQQLFERIDSPLSFWDRVRDLFLSPINGMYGRIDPDTNQVGPFNQGRMFGSVDVFLFILAIGGFMTVVFKTGSLNLGIAHLAHRFRARGAVLIIVLSVLFGILGSVMSWSDETLGFYALMIPLLLALGYDRIVVVAVVTVAPFVGSIGATVNPFRIGVGSDAAGVTMGDGIVLRLILLVLVMTVTIGYTLRYAKRVKANPELSLVPHDPEDFELIRQASSDDLKALSGTDKAVLGVVTFTFLLMIFSIVPWGAILDNTKILNYDEVDPLKHEMINVPFSWELGWWMPQLTALFAVAAIVVGLVGRLGQAATSAAFIRGVMDFTGAAILVAVARGVAVILHNTQTTDTVLNAMSNVIGGRSSGVFVILLSIISFPLAFLVGSGSAGMALVMPILAPLGDFAGVDRSLIVTTYNSMGGVLLLLIPTNALLMAGLGLARVGFNVYFKFVLPLAGILTAITLAVLILGAL